MRRELRAGVRVRVRVHVYLFVYVFHLFLLPLHLSFAFILQKIGRNANLAECAFHAKTDKFPLHVVHMRCGLGCSVRTYLYTSSLYVSKAFRVC